jgi:hypothetical protein
MGTIDWIMSLATIVLLAFAAMGFWLADKIEPINEQPESVPYIWPPKNRDDEGIKPP